MGGERYNLASAMKAARQCRETRDEEFEDKFRLQQEKDGPKSRNKARGSQDRSPSSSPARKIPRGKGKGKGRGQGSDKNDKDKNDKDKNRKPPPKFDNKTLHREKNGKPICYPFNSHKGCSRDKCRMVHTCQFCLSDSHGMSDCNAK